MADKNSGSTGEEHRSYFRVDDIISVVANPVDIDTDKIEEIKQKVINSKAFTLMQDSDAHTGTGSGEPQSDDEHTKLFGMISEIKTKLDFIINHFMLDKEGLLEPEKKFVNISASGIRFTVEKPVNPGDVMEIKLLLPTYPPVAVFAYGEVKRAVKIDDKKYEVAIEYLNLGDSVRTEIIQYTLSHQRETNRKMRESG